MVSTRHRIAFAAVAIASAYAGSVIVAPPVSAAPPQGVVALDCVKNGGLSPASPTGYRLLVPWDEAEGAWHGKWTPVLDVAGHYTARWGLNGGPASEQADLRIAIDGTNVRIVRTQAKGTCTYTGALSGDGWRAGGTYTCTWAPTPQRWSAAIGPGRAVTLKSCNEKSDSRYDVAWRETEGEWAGDWQPNTSVGNSNGLFSAHWTKGAEGARSQLQITITGRNVTVLRSEGRGTCTYNGTLGPNGWTASGTYRCAWDGPRDRHPWSAVIGNGAPPPDGTRPLGS